VENKASVLYDTKKVGVVSGFVCKDNTLLSSDDRH